MKLILTKCAICEQKNDFTVLYKANFSEKDFNKDTFSARRLPDRVHYQVVKCNKDGLVRSNPTLNQSDLAKLYKISKLNYSDEANNLVLTYINSLKNVLSKISTKDNILELGCGNGFILEKLYNMGYNHVYGVEPSVEAVNRADRSIRDKIKIDILKKGLFKNRSFKLIFFFQTLDHIPDPNRFLKDCYDLLDEGGYILAFNHNIDSPSAVIFKDKSPIIDIEHTYLYSPQTIKAMFEKHKFKIIKSYSPENLVSFRHLIQLIPLPKILKKLILKSKPPLLSLSLSIKLGNLCIIGQK